MAIPGLEIFRCCDDFGQIRVFQEGSKRYLAFGEQAEQSCMDMATPAVLVFEYNQAMALALLFQPEPAHIAVLGLGAGSLVTSLLTYNDTTIFDLVELRPMVVDVARQWFDLNLSEQTPNRLCLHLKDATLYIKDPDRISDIIFADIYNDEGMIEQQISLCFLQDCFDQLSAEGVLVLNLWEQGKGKHPQALHRISEIFGGQAMTCLVEDGNLIAFAFKGKTPELNPRRLQPRIKNLARRLNIPVHALVNRLQVI